MNQSAGYIPKSSLLWSAFLHELPSEDLLNAIYQSLDFGSKSTKKEEKITLSCTALEPRLVDCGGTIQVFCYYS